MENNMIQSNKELNQPILPRSTWVSNVAYLRALFKAKKALDRIEKEAKIIK
ncbi:hypothetical protein [Crocosphaera chwakensis]|uniref:Uncharacterized protein n=1 Tax=Crocosphaera chwakensis CCY0110 TaxID=391612 RepID=A3IKR5_9CHRO|nr:hypothetical protein [Crocosphaera chwakensis]EAZ92784.1 hypothetical protein CY0110_21847 [Crocosphaera chwakensis CCY0110]